MPNTPAQHWHRDAATLFPYREVDLPAHGVVVFMPLVDVPMEKGPTEFLLRSHLPCEKHKLQSVQLPDLNVDFTHKSGAWTLDECPWSTERYGIGSISPQKNIVLIGQLFVLCRFVAVAQAGDCVMFDLRILHRGGANTTPEQRPVLYLTYTQEWFVDAVNFNSKQTKSFDSLDPGLRKLVSVRLRYHYNLVNDPFFFTMVFLFSFFFFLFFSFFLFFYWRFVLHLSFRYRG
jgi:ectoine hydroxylase-related dioxygenase (phytanoyl-CoA dioxygenase family)